MQRSSENNDSLIFKQMLPVAMLSRFVLTFWKNCLQQVGHFEGVL